jgi:hypothetical protein
MNGLLGLAFKDSDLGSRKAPIPRNGRAGRRRTCRKGDGRCAARTPVAARRTMGDGNGRRVPPAGLEPATPHLGNECSIQLSYGGIPCTSA